MTVEEFNKIHAPGATAEENPEKGIDINYFGSLNPVPAIMLTKKGFIYTRKTVITTPMLNHITRMNNQLQRKEMKPKFKTGDKIKMINTRAKILGTVVKHLEDNVYVTDLEWYQKKTDKYPDREFKSFTYECDMELINNPEIPDSSTSKIAQFMKLPKEEQNKLLKEQAEASVDYYAEDQELKEFRDAGLSCPFILIQPYITTNFNDGLMTYPEICDLYGMLIIAYEAEFGKEPRTAEEYSTDLQLIKELEALVKDFTQSDLDTILNNKRLIDKIKLHRVHNPLHKRPIVFLIYHVMIKNRNAFRYFSPFVPEHLIPFYVDLGISQRDY